MTVISFYPLIPLLLSNVAAPNPVKRSPACLPSLIGCRSTRIYLVGSDLHSVPIDPWQNIHEEFGVIGNIALLKFGILVVEGEAERR